MIIGENRSFDHVFATYVPKHGESVDNLLSKGIVKLDANKNAIPGPNFEKAQQLAATDVGTRCVPAEPAQAGIPEQSASGSARGWRQSFLHPEPVQRGDPGNRMRRQPYASPAIRKTDWPPTTTSSSSAAAPA